MKTIEIIATIATYIREAASIEELIKLMTKCINLVTYKCAGVEKCIDEFFVLACIKAIRMGEFDKLMFEFPARCKMFLVTHGWDWDMVDNCFDDRRWDMFDKCYYAKRTWYNAKKRGIA